MHTLKEILRIPDLIEKTEKLLVKLSREENYLFVGCGSSYNLGLILSRTFVKHGYRAEVISGGQVVIKGRIPDSGKAILLSRTGESSETVFAANKLKKLGYETLGISCVPSSELLKVCGESMALDYANEESIVMTGSFSAILYLFLKNVGGNILPEEAETVLNRGAEIIDSIDLARYSHFVFLGFEELYGIAKEGALKIQEMAQQPTEFHEPLEYRHGPISNLTNKTFVVLQSMGTKHEEELSKELKNMGAYVLEIGPGGDIDVKYKNGLESPLRVIPLFYLGYKKAITEGLNPDKPRNLSKSVKTNLD
ncbi:sugar isomerase [Kosmotoga arenicorallina S304]|uniref:Sugar isomerase n=1 Tax=Kosmotoga arenicorallina S304 TaxID=1453497 RepID=A0A182C874_9BACT|nr:SIS domain-containing protein [Kosmotoga arenicorallina]OAA31648.1 sugar isomerase [Kosmotoga arenicorallina S304]